MFSVVQIGIIRSYIWMPVIKRYQYRDTVALNLSSSITREKNDTFFWKQNRKSSSFALQKFTLISPIVWCLIPNAKCYKYLSIYHRNVKLCKYYMQTKYIFLPVPNLCNPGFKNLLRQNFRNTRNTFFKSFM